MFVVLCVSAATLILIVGILQDYVRIRCIPVLTRPGSADEPDLPWVSLVIPARNEAHNIGLCLDGILAQTYDRYDVIVIDDGSTDETPAILARYAEAHTRLRVFQGASLPADWTGKCYACQQGVGYAQGEWVLFLDADTRPRPDLVAAMVTHAQHHQFDMLTIFPFQELITFWERLLVPAFLGLIHAIFPIERVNAPDARPDETVALGQCMLVRRSAYEQVGGHACVKGTVLEDVRLAQAFRITGFRVGAADGTHDLHVRMYTSRQEVVEGLTKNAREGFRSGQQRSVWVGARQIMLAFGPFDLLILGVFLLISHADMLAWAVFLHGVVTMVLALSFWIWLLRRWYGLSWIFALLWPLGVACYSTIALRSIWRVRRGHGVIWKGRTYVGE